MISTTRINVLVLALALAGCATPMAEQDAALTKKPVCCKSAAEFAYADLPPDRAQTTSLGASSPVYDFPAGRSYFSAFRVDARPSRRVKVESSFNGRFIGQYLHPIFLFLDGQHRPIATLVPRMQFVDAKLIPYTVAHMEGAIDVPDNARFVVVHTGKLEGAAVAKTGASVNVIPAGGNPFVMYSPGSRINLERSPTGELKLQLLDASKSAR